MTAANSTTAATPAEIGPAGRAVPTHVPAPSPMPVPDLASLLRPRPLRRKPIDPTRLPSPPDAEDPIPADLTDPTAAPAGHPQQTPASPSPPPGSPVTADSRREPTRSHATFGASDTGTDVAAAPRQYLRSIALYLPRELHRQLHEAAVERGSTATALILTAVNATHAQLPARLAPAVAERGGEQLFDVPQSRRRGEPSVATTLRVTDSQYEALAQLVQRHQSNRSAIITAALRLYLPTGAAEH